MNGIVYTGWDVHTGFLPLAQRASYLALQSFFFGPVVQVIMIILSLTALTGLRCIPNVAHTNHF